MQFSPFSLFRLYTSLFNCKHIIEETTSYLTANETVIGAGGSSATRIVYSLDDVSILQSPTKEASAFKQPEIFFDLGKDFDEKKIVLFNSNLNGGHRYEIVSVRVNTPHVQVFDESAQLLVENVQVSHVWPNSEGGPLYVPDTTRLPSSSPKSLLAHSLDFDANSFELLFEVNLKPLAYATYTIRRTTSQTQLNMTTINARVDFYQRDTGDTDAQEQIKSQIKAKSNAFSPAHINFFTTNPSGDLDEEKMISIELGIDGSKALFSSKTGFLQKITLGKFHYIHQSSNIPKRLYEQQLVRAIVLRNRHPELNNSTFLYDTRIFNVYFEFEICKLIFN